MQLAEPVERRHVPAPVPLEPGETYHSYNRGIDGVSLFRDTRNYGHFLGLYARYIEAVAANYAYCLLPNHFHFLVRIRAGIERRLSPSRQFNNLFMAYAKGYNKAYGRTGGLFESPFKRIRVDHDRYFAALVVYIHCNPQSHGLVRDFRGWAHSSYRATLSRIPTRLEREAVLEWFGGSDGFLAAHDLDPEREALADLVPEEW